LKKKECGKVFASQNVKIVGGVTATPNSWPSIAYLEFNYRQNYRLPTGITVQATFGSACGGTLIDRQTVLTAAHCIQRTGQFTYQGATYTGDITPNAEYPTYGSMYTVYLGLHDKSALNAAPSVAMNVSSIRVVYKFNFRDFVNFGQSWNN
jgi:V8-like Glu-specific endopeptidase